jgi:hypothetical protein
MAVETVPIVELQVTIIVASLIAGALRGFLGYWLTAPEDEPFNPSKVGKTVVRYAIFNLVSVNLIAYSGVVWTVTGVFIYTLAQLATELGFDLKKT